MAGLARETFASKTVFGHTECMPLMQLGGRTVQVRRLALEVSEAASVLRCSPQDVRNLVRRGELADVSANRTRRIDPLELAQLAARRAQAGELSHMALVDLARLVSRPQ